MTKKEVWKGEDEVRHKRAISALLATGYVLDSTKLLRSTRPAPSGPQTLPRRGKSARKGKAG